MRLAPENSLSVKKCINIGIVLLLKFCIYKPRVQTPWGQCADVSIIWGFSAKKKKTPSGFQEGGYSGEQVA